MCVCVHNNNRHTVKLTKYIPQRGRKISSYNQRYLPIRVGIHRDRMRSTTIQECVLNQVLTIRVGLGT